MSEINTKKIGVSLGSRGSLSADVGSYGMSAKISEGTRYAEVAGRLRYDRSISLIGDAVGETVFNGSKDVEIATVVGILTNEELEDLLK